MLVPIEVQQPVTEPLTQRHRSEVTHAATASASMQAEDLIVVDEPPTKRSRCEASNPLSQPQSSSSASAPRPTPVLIRRNTNLCQDPDFDAALILGYDDTPQALEDNTFCALQNLGNTCYANALLNALTKIPLMRFWLLQHQQLAAHDHAHPAGCLLCALAHDIARLATLPDNVPFPPSIVEKRSEWTDGWIFDNEDQQDANDAFFKMLDTCNEIDFQALQRTEVGANVLPMSRIAYTTPFWKLFGTLVREETHCATCAKSTIDHVYKSTHTIVVPEAGRHLIENVFMDQLGHEPLGSLEIPDHCTYDPATPELGGCNARNTRHKTTTILQCAPVLVLHLLRFTWDPQQRRPVKLQTHIDFETVLPPITGTAHYDLRAVVQHRGQHPTSANSGHYTAYVRASDAQWYHCDDWVQPRRCPVDEVRRAQAYMLFYERR